MAQTAQQSTVMQILELMKAQTELLKTMNTHILSLQEAIRNQGVSPEELAALKAKAEENNQIIQDVFTPAVKQ